MVEASSLGDTSAARQSAQPPTRCPISSTTFNACSSHCSVIATTRHLITPISRTGLLCMHQRRLLCAQLLRLTATGLPPRHLGRPAEAMHPIQMCNLKCRSTNALLHYPYNQLITAAHLQREGGVYVDIKA